METKLIKLTKNQKKHMRPLVEQLNSADVGFDTASRNIRTSRNIIWKELTKMYPESHNKGASFDHNTFEITYTEVKSENT